MWRKPEMPCAKSNSRPVFDTIDTPSTIFAGTSKICQKKYMLNQAWHFSISFFLSYIYGCYYRASHTSYLQTQMLYNRIAVEKWLSEKKAGLANSTIHIEFHLISAIFYLKKILEYFGCIQKIQKTLLSNFRGLWTYILRSLPTSRLLLKAPLLS